MASIVLDRAGLTFRVRQPGDYTVVCTVPGHEQLGMVGTLTITGPR